MGPEAATGSVFSRSWGTSAWRDRCPVCERFEFGECVRWTHRVASLTASASRMLQALAAGVGHLRGAHSGIRRRSARTCRGLSPVPVEGTRADLLQRLRLGRTGRHPRIIPHAPVNAIACTNRSKCGEIIR
jgi:hypothetical protein